MRGVLLGLFIGLVVGAGAMYLVLRPPWAGGVAAPRDAGVVATSTGDGGVAKPKKKRRRAAGSPGQPDPDEYDETEPVVLSDADRRLEWRGDDVSLPAQKIDMSGGEARSLEDGEINTVISRQSGGIRDCVAQGAAGTDLRATITIKLVVDGNGRVTRSKIQAPRYLFSQGLLGCAQRAARQMKFTATGAPTLVTFPVNLG